MHATITSDMIAFVRARLAEHTATDPQVREWLIAMRSIVDAYADVADDDDPDISFEHATGRACGLGEAVRAIAAAWEHHPHHRAAWT